MSNVKTIPQIYEAFGRGDIAAIGERFADNARWEHHRPATLRRNTMFRT